ncbi:MAG TPA: alpha/beta hydrolase [Actinomycetales bacterium]|nr:alpha/beta hydrolase [Actinomycetales bacterium]
MESTRTRPLLVVAAALVLIGVLVIVVVGLQRRLIYFPDRSPAGAAAQAAPGAEDVTLTTEDGLELGAWLVPPAPAADRGIAVLAAPGNAGNRAGRASLAEALSRRGFTTLLIDYRGYGGNPGSPTEEGLARDARAAADLLASRGFEPGCTLYFGESIGTGVIAGLTTTHPPAGALLRSPFPSFASVAKVHYPWLPVDLILADRYPALENLAGSPVPVRILAGTADDIVPFALSEQLAAGVGNLEEFVAIEGAGHNNAFWFGDFAADHTALLADHVIGQGCGPG